MARSFGLEMQVIGPQEAYDLFPLIDPKGVLGAAFIPSDGQVDPASLCQAIAAGARRQGVQIVQGRKVLDATITDGRITEVQTDDGIRSEEHTSELQSLMRISYAVFCLKKQKKHKYT